jgi:hypothetical protein
LQDTISYTHAPHVFHFGFTFRRVQLNSLNDPTPRGQYNFTGLMTQNYQLVNGEEQPISGTGSPLADFLMDLPAGTALKFSDSTYYLRTHGFIGYFTDDWHIFPRFTVSYGLRYELMFAPYELNNRLADLDVNPTFSAASVVTAGSTGPYSGPLPNSLVRTNYNNFAPRMAIAWRVPGKWFDANNGRHALNIRAGYSVFDITSTYNALAQSDLINQPPFATGFSANTLPTALLTLQNGFLGESSTGINSIAVSPNFHNPYLQIWNLSLESQIVDGLVWSVAYIGEKATDLDQLIAPNVLSTTSLALQGKSIPQNLAFTYDTSGASSNYNALQGRLLKRMRNGFTWQAIYTFSKALDNSSSIGGTSGTVVQEYPLFNLERGLSTFNQKHSITGNSTYELPFGERKRWAHKGAEARILGNWRVSGSTTFHTGTPLTPTDQTALTQYTSSNFVTRPDILPGCNLSLPSGQRSVTEFFNTSCFGVPGADFPGTGVVAPGNLFGDAGRDIITGPTMFVVNTALQRTITLDRDAQRHLDIRWEVTNLANHPYYSGIALNSTSRNFGDVTSASGLRTMDLVVRLNF